VRVDRYRDLDVAMTDDVPDHVRSDAQVQQERDARVSHVVEPCASEPSCEADTAPASAEVVGLHGSADTGREDKPVLLPVRPGIGPLGELLAPVLTKRVDAQRRERMVRAESAVLGRTKRSAPPTR